MRFKGNIGESLQCVTTSRHYKRGQTVILYQLTTGL